jgi:hypothetical protein
VMREAERASRSRDLGARFGPLEQQERSLGRMASGGARSNCLLVTPFGAAGRWPFAYQGKP